MQLSVSTTPPDPTLAAHFAVAGASASHDTLSGAAATATDAAQPDAFAALLSDATPASSPTAATGPGLGSSLTGPTAAATIANFPSWLAADATTANAIPSGAGSGTSPSVPANRSAEMLAGDASTTMPENETMGGAPVIGHPGRGAISPGKRGHTVKSSVSRTGTTDSTRPHPALTANPVVVPMVIAPGLTLGLPGVGDSNSRSSLDETNVTPESETADENENLPMALTPVSSRKEGKSSASPRWLISGEDGDDIPTAASDTGQKGAGRFQLTPPVALAATTPTAPSETTEAAESAEKQAPGFAAIPAFRRSNSDQGAAAPMLTTANRRAPIQREFVGPEVSSTTTDDVPAAAATSASSLSASMGPVPGASPEVAFQSASELSTEPVVEAIVTSSPIAQEKGRDQASDRAPSLLRFENTIPTRAEIFAAFDGNTVAEKKTRWGSLIKHF